MKKVIIWLIVILTCISAKAQYIRPSQLIGFSSNNNLMGTDFGIVADGTTDNTTAFNRLMDTAIARQNCRVILPAGVILVDTVAITGVGSWVNIEITGSGRPSFLWGTAGAFTLPNSGTVIKTSRTASAGTIFQQKSFSSSFSFIHLVLRNLEFRASNDPFVNGVDALRCSQFEMYDCFINTGIYNMQAKTATHSTFGLRTPDKDNGAVTIVNNVVVTGFWEGIIANEHFNGDNIGIGSTHFGIDFNTGNVHASNVNRLLIQRSRYPVTVNSPASPSRLNITQLVIEHADSATQTVDSTRWVITYADIYDPSNYGRGFISFSASTGNVGLGYTLTKSGGQFIQVREMGDGISNLSLNGVHVGFDAYDNIAAISSSAPPYLSFGGYYADDNTAAKMKLRIYDDGNSGHYAGFGLSSGQLNYFTGTGTTHNFYIVGTKEAEIVTGGLKLPTMAAGVGTKAVRINPATGLLTYADTSSGGGGSGVTGFTTFGSTPNANGGSVSGSNAILQPADGSNPGGVSTTTQTFAGVKTFAAHQIFGTGGANNFLSNFYEASNPFLNIQNSSTGTGSGNGLALGIIGSTNGYLGMQDNMPLWFYTNSVARFKILNNGNITMTGNFDPAGIVTIGGTNKFQAQGDYAGGGEFGAGVLLGSTTATDLSFFPDLTNGTAGAKVTMGYFAGGGGGVRSAVQVANVSSGFSHLDLMKSGGAVNVGTTTSSATAVLKVESTTQGFLPPRMTTTQKNAISSPAEGLIVYDLTLHKLCVYTGSAWETITSL